MRSPRGSARAWGAAAPPRLAAPPPSRSSRATTPSFVFTAFTVPAELRRAPCGWFAIAGEPPMLYAARAGELAAMGLL